MGIEFYTALVSIFIIGIIIIIFLVMTPSKQPGPRRPRPGAVSKTGKGKGAKERKDKSGVVKGKGRPGIGKTGAKKEVKFIMVDEEEPVSVSELDEVKKFETEHLAPDFVNLDVEGSRPIVGRIKTEKCQDCRLHNVCEGIWREYYKQYGDSELKPILK